MLGGNLGSLSYGDVSVMQNHRLRRVNSKLLGGLKDILHCAQTSALDLDVILSTRNVRSYLTFSDKTSNKLSTVGTGHYKTS